MTDVLRILAGPLVWLAAFSAVYGLHGLICGHGLEGSILGISAARLSMVAAYVVVILLQVGLLWGLLRGRRFAPSSPFVGFVSRATGLTGLAATVWTLFPTITTTHCL